MGEERILLSTAYEIAVAALAPEARPGDEYFEKLIKDSKEPEITIDFEEIDRPESRVNRLFVDSLAGRRMLVYHRLNGEWKEAGDPECWRTAGFGVPGALSLTDESSTCGPDGKLDAYIIRADFEKWLASFNGAPSEETQSDPPSPLQAKVREIACRLWPDGKLPARVKDRDDQIIKAWPSEESPPDRKTIQRAFKNWTPQDK